MTIYVIWSAPEIGYICNLACSPKTIFVILPLHFFPLPPIMPLGMKARNRMLLGSSYCYCRCAIGSSYCTPGGIEIFILLPFRTVWPFILLPFWILAPSFSLLQLAADCRSSHRSSLRRDLPPDAIHLCPRWSEDLVWESFAWPDDCDYDRVA